MDPPFLEWFWFGLVFIGSKALVFIYSKPLVLTSHISSIQSPREPDIPNLQMRSPTSQGPGISDSLWIGTKACMPRKLWSSNRGKNEKKKMLG